MYHVYLLFAGVVIVGPSAHVAASLIEVLQYHPRLLQGEPSEGGAATTALERRGPRERLGAASEIVGEYWSFPSTSGFQPPHKFAAALVKGYVDKFEAALKANQRKQRKKADDPKSDAAGLPVSALRFFDGGGGAYAHDSRAPYRLHAVLPTTAAIVLTITDPFRQTCDTLSSTLDEAHVLAGGHHAKVDAVRSFKNRVKEEFDAVREYRSCRGRALLQFLYPSCIASLSHETAQVRC